ncbi:GNAT family N-acetyltransferase [Fuscibacter oryzae]|uniref:N-acetyltransferase n=1 Tax=Fuscibacter oryzae TaxID=2803939 RepID=A0A8J7SQZ4_9RHOB|nr:GNAT family N-acetyltransferase [Fuscibacter oryzae]MBL4926510.1 N-acetyltransferase [Fuscibacter oryzae]
MIRPALPQDAPAIAEIWNRVIRETTQTFTTVEKSADDIATRIAQGAPWWVAEADGTILGHATYGPFRSGPGYAQTMEHSVHLTDAAKGKGLGRALMAALEDHAHAAGIHVMVAGISGGNAAGLAFHSALGYAEVGRMPEVGQKWGQRLHLVLMQKILS